jgi:hypothetical protein
MKLRFCLCKIAFVIHGNLTEKWWSFPVDVEVEQQRQQSKAQTAKYLLRLAQSIFKPFQSLFQKLANMTEFTNPSNPYLTKLHEVASSNNFSTINSLEFAKHMDEADELKGFRNEFCFPKVAEGKRPIYLCGNSLGLQPKRLRAEVVGQLDKWEREAVEGHFTGKFQYHCCFFGCALFCCYLLSIFLVCR